MVQTLEAIKGGGGSIKLGTTGTIGALMSRELASNKSSPRIPVMSRNRSPTASRASADEVRSSKSMNHKRTEISKKARSYNRKTHQIPMLDSDNISLDGSPIEKPVKKGPYIVEIVDVRCRNLDRKWATPITTRIKKLGFSKLSQSIV